MTYLKSKWTRRLHQVAVWMGPLRHLRLKLPHRPIPRAVQLKVFIAINNIYSYCEILSNYSRAVSSIVLISSFFFCKHFKSAVFILSVLLTVKCMEGSSIPFDHLYQCSLRQQLKPCLLLIMIITLPVLLFIKRF